jgi:hypothetical protein
MSRYQTHLVCALALAWNLSAEAAPPSFNLQLSVGSEDDGRSSERFTQLTGAYRYSKGLSRQSSLNFNADLSTQKFSKTASKDNHSLLLEGVYNYVPSPGFTKPVYSVILRQQFESFDNSAFDTSDTALLLVDFFRINENLSFVGGLEFIDSSSDIVDTSTIGLFAGLDYWLSNKIMAYTNVKLQDEQNDINLAALQTSPRIAQRSLIAGAHLPGEAGFQGNANATSPTQGSGSQNDSDNLFITVGLNYEIDSRQSIDFSLARFNYDTVVDTTIKQISLDYFFRFE